MELFVMLCKVVQTLYVLAWNPKFATIYMKATEQYSNPVVLFTILYTVVLPFRVIFESVDEILKCNQSNQSNWAVLSSGTLKNTLHESIFHLFKAVDKFLNFTDLSNQSSVVNRT